MVLFFKTLVYTNAKINIIDLHTKICWNFNISSIPELNKIKCLSCCYYVYIIYFNPSTYILSRNNIFYYTGKKKNCCQLKLK